MRRYKNNILILLILSLSMAFMSIGLSLVPIVGAHDVAGESTQDKAASAVNEDAEHDGADYPSDKPADDKAGSPNDDMKSTNTDKTNSGVVRLKSTNGSTYANYEDGRLVLPCVASGANATGPMAKDFCWIDWANLQTIDYTNTIPGENNRGRWTC